MDIGQGAGLATTSGVRPLVPPIVAGVLAHADAGIDFSGTDWAWMESWWWIGILLAAFIAGWLFDRSGTNDKGQGPRPEENVAGYGLLAAAMGALTFAASLAGNDYMAWPGLLGGAALAFIGYLAFARLFMRATQRLQAAGDPGTLLGLARDAIGVSISVLVVFVGALGYLVAAAALVLLVAARGRGDEKYEGLRVLR